MDEFKKNDDTNTENIGSLKSDELSHKQDTANNHARNGTYYYSYGPFKSGDANEESDETVPQSNDVDNLTPKPQRSYADGQYQDRRMGKNRSSHRRSSFKSMFAAFLAGAVVISSLMFASDKLNLFTGGHAANPPTNSNTAVTNNANQGNVHNVSFPVVRPNNISQIVKKASPAVVKVENFQKVQAQSNNPFANDPFFQQFFGGGNSGGNQNFLDPFSGNGSGNSKKNSSGSLREIGLGSGFFFDKSGLILTNDHVVAGANKVKVVVEGRKKPLIAKVLGTSSSYDLAVLKVPGNNYPYLKLGNSNNLSVGSWLIAIGNPYGFDHTVTVGVLSATGRDIPVQDNNKTRQYRHLLQTDASINPGNSGGPLLDLNGNVIGINTAVSKQAQGIGFAIPTSTITPLLNRLKNGQNVSQHLPFVGVMLRNIQQAWVSQLNLDSTDGALVDQVGFNTPAYKAGLQKYDVITAINGTKIKNAQDVVNQVHKLKVGDHAVFSIIRNGQQKKITVIIGDKSKYVHQ